MKTIRSWSDIPPAQPGDVLVCDLLRLGGSHFIPGSPRYSVDIAHERCLGHFFEEQDALEYASAIESKSIIPYPIRKEPK